jgi:DNA-binding MarR family transcriptional regulator
MHAEADELTTVLEEVVRLFRHVNPAGGLSLTSAATLASLDREGPARLTELATQQGVSQPAMTQLVTRLQDAGLAERVPDPDDGRVVRVHITETGRSELARRRAARIARLGTLFDRLSAGERAALSAALPAIRALTQLAAEPQEGAAV